MTIRINDGVIIDMTSTGWDEFKKWINGTNANLRFVWEDEGQSYNIVAIDGSVYRTFGINKEDASEFEAVYKSIVTTIQSSNIDGRQRVTAEKSNIPKKTFISHDWTDKTTWTEASARIVDEVASGSGNGLNYSLSFIDIIDTYHGKITHEDYLTDGSNSYRVVVKVNGVPKAEQDPHVGAGGDYVVNYNSGTITFNSQLSGSDQVQVTYHHASSSIFTIRPDSGNVIRLDFAEVQFSSNVIVKDSVIFQPYGFVDVFAPQLLTTNGGPLPPGTKIPLGNPVKYKTMRDYQNEAVKSYPAYDAIGGSGWRGTPFGVVVLDWDYVSSTVLKSSCGMEIRIYLEHNEPFGGSYATATFYCTSEKE